MRKPSGNGYLFLGGNALARAQACLEMLALEVEDRPEALDLIRRISFQQTFSQSAGHSSRSALAANIAYSNPLSSIFQFNTSIKISTYFTR